MDKEAAEVTALRERFQNMKIVARAKVTQDRVYSAAYHPDPTTDLIFFGGECTFRDRAFCQGFGNVSADGVPRER
jgi:hypothetical protein